MTHRFGLDGLAGGGELELDAEHRAVDRLVQHRGGDVAVRGGAVDRQIMRPDEGDAGAVGEAGRLVER